jgi:hypothetical protein
MLSHAEYERLVTTDRKAEEKNGLFSGLEDDGQPPW